MRATSGLCLRIIGTDSTIFSSYWSLHSALGAVRSFPHFTGSNRRGGYDFCRLLTGTSSGMFPYLLRYVFGAFPGIIGYVLSAKLAVHVMFAWSRPFAEHLCVCFSHKASIGSPGRLVISTLSFPLLRLYFSLFHLVSNTNGSANRTKERLFYSFVGSNHGLLVLGAVLGTLQEKLDRAVETSLGEFRIATEERNESYYGIELHYQLNILRCFLLPVIYGAFLSIAPRLFEKPSVVCFLLLPKHLTVIAVVFIFCSL